MNRIVIAIVLVLSAFSVQAYEATCGELYIEVANKVLTVNNKFDHDYEGRTTDGSYRYSNRHYIYVAGKFSESGEFTLTSLRRSDDQLLVRNCEKDGYNSMAAAAQYGKSLAEILNR